ncbi:MAG: LapA family protein [Chloroflexota bacterium]|nr:LapA family protein [Chloroflexota bacterium]
MDEPRPWSWRPGRATQVVIWLVLLATGLGLLVFFVADNFVLVDVRLFTFQRQMRLAWALLIAFAVGALFGAVAARRR